MTITEDKTDGKVIIDGFAIDGFVDGASCPDCSANRIYFEKYDSSFCPNCNVWLESKCSDSTCEFCGKRPAEPLQ